MSGRAELYSNAQRIPHSLISLFLGWGIYLWPSNERGARGSGPGFRAQGSHITEAFTLLLLVGTAEAPRGLGALWLRACLFPLAGL